jgi:hypothetical protein
MNIKERVGGTIQEPKLLTNNFQKQIGKRIALIQLQKHASKHLDSKAGSILKGILGGSNNVPLKTARLIL